MEGIRPHHQGTSFSSCLLAAVGSEFLVAGRYAACATAFMGVLSNEKMRAVVKGHLMYPPVHVMENGNSGNNSGGRGKTATTAGAVSGARRSDADISPRGGGGGVPMSPSRMMSRSGEGARAEGEEGAGAIIDILHVFSLAARPYDMCNTSKNDTSKASTSTAGDGWGVRVGTVLGPVRLKQLCKEERAAYLAR